MIALCAEALGQRLMEIGINKKIEHITWHQLTLLASDVIEAWIVNRSKREEFWKQHESCAQSVMLVPGGLGG